MKSYVWTKLYILLIIMISLIFIGFNIWADVEQTNIVLKDFIKGKDCPHFIEANYLTMKDECTGLVWARRELPTYDQVNDTAPGYNWQQAKDACAALEPANMFRLPTAEELLSLIKYRCDDITCYAKAEIAYDDFSKPPIFGGGTYWTISDFNEPSSWTNVGAVPPGKEIRDYKRSVNLLNGEVDNPIYNLEMRLNAWCVVDHNPEVVDKKFTEVPSANILSVSNGQQVNGGTMKTVYHRECDTDAGCQDIISGSICENINNTVSTLICQGDDPANSISCPGDDVGVPANTDKQVVPICTAATKCEYTCLTGYTPVGNTCEPIIYNCMGDDPPNAMLCFDDDQNLTANVNKSTVFDCTDTVKCEYYCNSPYIFTGSVCEIPQFTCTGPQPANTTICPNDNIGLQENVEITLEPDCSAPIKCKYVCSPGYYYTGNSCAPYLCEGTPPSHATMCPGDNIDVPNAGIQNHVETSCTVTKCEYTCDAGWEKTGNWCSLIENPPIVEIISPDDNESFFATKIQKNSGKYNPDITISVRATGVGSGIDHIELYQGFQQIAYLDCTSSPCNKNFTWTDVPYGTYELKARAESTGSGGHDWGESVVVNITVKREICGNAHVDDDGDGDHDEQCIEAKFSFFDCAMTRGDNADDRFDLWVGGVKIGESQFGENQKLEYNYNLPKGLHKITSRYLETNVTEECFDECVNFNRNMAWSTNPVCPSTNQGTCVLGTREACTLRYVNEYWEGVVEID